MQQRVSLHHEALTSGVPDVVAVLASRQAYFEPSAGDQKFKPTFTKNAFLAAKAWDDRRPVVFRASSAAQAGKDLLNEDARSNDLDWDDDDLRGAYGIPPPAPKSAKVQSFTSTPLNALSMWMVSLTGYCFLGAATRAKGVARDNLLADRCRRNLGCNDGIRSASSSAGVLIFAHEGVHLCESVDVMYE